MSYEIQTIEQEPLSMRGVSQTIPLSINQSGFHSTLIGHVDNLNLTISSLPSFCGNNKLYQPAKINCGCFNLFVIGCEDFNRGYFTVSKECALTKCIAPELKKQYARLTGTAIESIKTFPSIFASENRRSAATDVDHQAFYGFVTDIQLLPNDVRITYALNYRIPQQRLNEIADELALRQAPLANELNDTHWTIKRVNLLDALKSISVPVFASV